MPQIAVSSTPVYLPEDRNAQTLFLQNPAAAGGADLVALPSREPAITANAVAATDGILLPAAAASPLILQGGLARCAWTFLRAGGSDGVLRYFRSAMSDEDII